MPGFRPALFSDGAPSSTARWTRAVSAGVALLLVIAGLALSSASAAVGAPGSPTAVNLTRGDTVLKVAWTAPADTGGSAVSTYTASASPGSRSCTSATTTCVISGLTNGTAYTVSVTATNGSGTSAASEASTAATPGVPDRFDLAVIAGTGAAAKSVAGPGTQSPLNAPTGPAVDALGNVYVADGGNHQILKLVPQSSGGYTVSVIAGTGTSGAPTVGPATASALNLPGSVAVDATGNVFVADTSNHRIEKLTPQSDGTYRLTTVAGKGTSGVPTAGPATNSSLNFPSAVAVDSSGNLYVADLGNNRIEKLTLQSDGTYVLAVIGGTGTTGAPTPGAATNSKIGSPYAIAVDSSGSVYVGEGTARIVKLTPATGGTYTLSVIAGTGSIGAPTAGLATSSTLGTPKGLAVDLAGNVYVSDFNYHVVEKLTPGSGGAYTLAVIAGKSSTSGAPTAGPALSSTLNRPSGLAVDPSGVLIVADTFNNRIESLTPFYYDPPGVPTDVTAQGFYAGVVVAWKAPTTTGGAAISGYTVTSSPGGKTCTTAGQLSCVLSDLTNETDYTFTVTATNGFRTSAASAKSGSVTARIPDRYDLGTIAGDGTAGTPTPGTATLSQLDRPISAAVDGDGNVYVADYGNHRIEKLTPNAIDGGYTLSVIAGGNAPGTPTAGPATSSKLRSPSGVAVDASGNVYVADTSNNVIEKLTPVAGGGYTLSVIAGTGSTGAPVAGPATASPLSLPQGVAVGADGTVFVADTGNNRIEKLTPVAGGGYTLAVIAGKQGAGQPTNGPATSSSLFVPIGIAIDAAGNLYIGDSNNKRVEKLTPQPDGTYTLTIIAGTGVNGTVTSGPALASKLGYPAGVAVDAGGNVFVADATNNQVQKLTPQSDGTYRLSVHAGTGTAGTPTRGPAGSSALNSPQGLAIDAAGALFVTEFGNHLVDRISPAYLTRPSKPLAVKAWGVDGGLRVSWSEPSTDGGVAITDYAVTASPGGATCAPTPVWKRTCTVTGLTAGTAYTVTVTATNGRGTSAASEESNSASPRTGYTLAIVAGNGASGTPVSGGRAVDQPLGVQMGTAIAAGGTFYLADAGQGVVAKVTADGTYSPIAGKLNTASRVSSTPAIGTTLTQLRKVAVAADGTIYVAEAQRVGKLTPAGDGTYAFQVIAGGGTGGIVEGAATQSSFGNIYGLAVDPAGLVYVVDSSARKVLRLTLDDATGAYRLAIVPTGTWTPAYPTGIAIDEQGSLFVADANANSVVRLTPSGQTYTATVIAGQSGRRGEPLEGPATETTINQPYGVAVDEAGNVYVSDIGTHEVYRLTPQADASYGLAILAGANTAAVPTAGPASMSTLNSPYGVSVDPGGRVYVSDYSSRRVLRLTPPPGDPGRAKSVTAIAGDQSATVSWKAPAATGGSDLAGYLVVATPGGRSCMVESLPLTTSCVVTGLTNGTSYTFTVTTTNMGGGSSLSAASASVTPANPATPVAGPTALAGALQGCTGTTTKPTYLAASGWVDPGGSLPALTVPCVASLDLAGQTVRLGAVSVAAGQGLGVIDSATPPGALSLASLALGDGAAATVAAGAKVTVADGVLTTTSSSSLTNDGTLALPGHMVGLTSAPTMAGSITGNAFALAFDPTPGTSTDDPTEYALVLAKKVADLGVSLPTPTASQIPEDMLFDGWSLTTSAGTTKVTADTDLAALLGRATGTLRTARLVATYVAAPALTGSLFVQVSATAPTIGTATTATLSSLFSQSGVALSWSWQRSSDGSTGWTAIDAATGTGATASYTPVAADRGRYLRVVGVATKDGYAKTRATSAATQAVAYGLMTSASELAAAIAGCTSGPLRLTLGADIVDALRTVQFAGCALTIDLAGHALGLASIGVGADSSLTVVDTGRLVEGTTRYGLLTLDGTPLVPDAAPIALVADSDDPPSVTIAAAVAIGGTVVVPKDSTLTIGSTGVLSEVSGTTAAITGAGTLTNNGTIRNEVAVDVGTVSGTATVVRFHLPDGTMQSVTVFADSLADAGVAFPSVLAGAQEYVRWGTTATGGERVVGDTSLTAPLDLYPIVLPAGTALASSLDQLRAALADSAVTTVRLAPGVAGADTAAAVLDLGSRTTQVTLDLAGVSATVAGVVVGDGQKLVVADSTTYPGTASLADRALLTVDASAATPAHPAIALAAGGIGASGGAFAVASGRVEVVGASSTPAIGDATSERAGALSVSGGALTVRGTPAVSTASVVVSGGSLTVTGVGAAAAGAAAGITADTVTVSGGTLTATGAAGSPGIGGTVGTVVAVSGGLVDATGGTAAAGIGGGTGQPGVTLAITGGTVIARAGDSTASAVGAGDATHDIGSISVSGGTLVLPTGRILLTDTTPSTPSLTIGTGGVVTGLTGLIGLDDAFASFASGPAGSVGVVSIDGGALKMPSSSWQGIGLLGDDYGVTFDLAGAAGETPDAVRLLAPSAGVGGFDLPTPTRAGFVFKGWNTAADGSGVTVTGTTDLGTLPGGSSIDGQPVPVALFAIWEAIVVPGPTEPSTSPSTSPSSSPTPTPTPTGSPTTAPVLPVATPTLTGGTGSGSGAPQVGVPVRVAVEVPSVEGAAVAYRWQVVAPDGTVIDIPGAIDASYVPTAQYAGYALQVVVTVTAPGYAPSVQVVTFRRSAEVQPGAFAPMRAIVRIVRGLRVHGVVHPVVGQRVRAKLPRGYRASLPEGTVVSYRWYVGRSRTPLASQAPRLTVRPGWAGKRLRLRVLLSARGYEPVEIVSKRTATVVLKRTR